MGTYAPMGEVLLHGLAAKPGDVSYRMPLATTMSARLQYHSPLPPAALLFLGRLLLIGLVVCLAGLLHPYAAWVAAGALLILTRDAQYELYPEYGYRMLFLMTACLLAWRARAPTLGKTVLLALAVGTTLLYRTPLVLFTPLLALREWAAARRSPVAGRWRQAAILCVVPYLFLLPWIGMNRAVHGRFIAFEKDAATANVVTGALGLVRSVEGDLSTLVDGQVDVERPGDVAAWAVREVARHPARYALAVVRRAAFAFSAEPELFVLALLSLWTFRRRPEFRALGFLAAYFVGVHCLMSVETVYFGPLRALFAVLAAAAVVGFRVKEPPGEETRGYRLSALGANAVLALALAAALAATGKVAAFAALARSGPGDASRELDLAVAAHPSDPWLLLRRGGARLEAGDAAGAAGDLSAVAAAAPEDAAVRLRLLWARAQLGDAGPLLEWRPPPRDGKDDPLDLPLDALILKACAHIREGRTAKAEASLRAALKLHLDRNVLVRGPHGEREREALEKLRTSDAGFARYCRSLQGARPEAERRALDALLRRLAS